MEKENKKLRSKTSILTQRELKQESKSWEAIQQSILIFLLTKKGYRITIERPDKFAHLSKHFFIISNVEREDKKMKFTEIIQQKSEEMMSNFVNIEQKQLKRHLDKSKSSLCVNLLIEICMKHHFDFTIRGTRSSIYTIKMQKFNEILFKNKILFSKNDILKLGSKVNDVLRELCIEACGKHNVVVCFDHFKFLTFNDLVNVPQEFLNFNEQFNEKNNFNFNENFNHFNYLEKGFDKIEKNSDDVVSRSTSRLDMERSNSPLSAFKRVELGRNYFVFSNF